MATIYTHDRIDLTNGLLAVPSLLWGQNALQTITITRNTPRNQQQAIGYLGVVDYTRGVVSSDAALDCILVEHNDSSEAEFLASENSTINKYAGLDVDLVSGDEIYALTSAALGFSAGNASTINYGWLTAGLASALAVKPQPVASDGDVFAMVLGDEGNGLVLIAEWKPMDGGGEPKQGTIPTLDADGNVVNTLTDSGIPAGVQSLNMTGNINRDQILDVRSTRPCFFQTTYPVDIGVDMEVYQKPDTSLITGTPNGWNYLKSITVASAASYMAAPN
ncbi:MAG: hypothetical protein FWD53_12560, partial [Phycisphaerales bacterium]|nr:hypothetical protein [Phycisphaerales bacterium]